MFVVRVVVRGYVHSAAPHDIYSCFDSPTPNISPANSMAPPKIPDVISAHDYSETPKKKKCNFLKNKKNKRTYLTGSF